MNSTRRVERNGTPIDICETSKGVRVGTGSYGNGHGLTIHLDLEYVAELLATDITSDVETLLGVALEQAQEEIESLPDRPSGKAGKRVTLSATFEYRDDEILAENSDEDLIEMSKEAFFLDGGELAGTVEEMPAAINPGAADD